MKNCTIDVQNNTGFLKNFVSIFDSINVYKMK